MSSNESSSDYESISQGPSERFERWGQGWRRSIYRTWPPTKAPSYPVWKRDRMHRNRTVETMGASDSHDESNRATISDDDLKARWQEVAERKVKVYAIRCRIKRARSRTEQARQERDDADNNFMSVLRPLRVHSTSLNAILSTNSLFAQFQRMQTTRDKYQQHEMEMINLEQSLVETQDELDLLERCLINDLRHLVTDDTAREPLGTQVLEQPPLELLKDLEIKPASIRDPLYQRLLSARRSLSLARRQLFGILARRKRLEEQERLFKMFEKYHPAALRYIAPLESRDLKFLNQFQIEEQRISAEIGDCHKEVELLTRRSWEGDLIPRYVPLEDALSWYRYPDESSIDVDLGLDHLEAADTEPIDFPILLSNPSHLLEDFPVTAEASLKRATSIPEGHPYRANAIASTAKEFSIQNLLSDAEDTPNFINRWLLQILRTSRLEVGLLYSSYLASGDIGIFDIETWQRDILHKWWGNESYLRTLEHFNPAQTSWISATPSPPSWLSEPFLLTWDSNTSDLDFKTSELEQTNDYGETKF